MEYIKTAGKMLFGLVAGAAGGYLIATIIHGRTDDTVFPGAILGIMFGPRIFGLAFPKDR